MKVAVLGATGHTGALVVEQLLERKAEVVACGRRTGALARLEGPRVEIRFADARERASLVTALRDVDAVCNLAGPFLAAGDAAVSVAVERGIPYVDTTGEQAFMDQVRRDHHAKAQAAGVPVVNALAFEYALSDLAARAKLADGGRALDVFYRPRGTQASAGTKKSVLRVMAAPGLGREDGRLVRVPSARHARTFRTPDGPRDGVSFPGGEILTIPTHTPFRTVRTYVPSKNAAVAKMLAPVARVALRGPLLALAEREVERRHRPPRNEKARGEIYLQADDGRGWLVRTPDPYVVTAHLQAEGALRLAQRRGPGGVLAPAVALDAPGMLDALGRAVAGFGVEAWDDS